MSDQSRAQKMQNRCVEILGERFQGDFITGLILTANESDVSLNDLNLPYFRPKRSIFRRFAFRKVNRLCKKQFYFGEIRFLQVS